MDTKNPFDLLIDQIRQVVREEIKAASENKATVPRVFTIKEVAAMLKVDESWVSDAGRTGLIKVTHVGRYVRFAENDLNAFIQSRMPR